MNSRRMDRKLATAPETWGAAMLVPESSTYTAVRPGGGACPPGEALVSALPGGARGVAVGGRRPRGGGAGRGVAGGGGGDALAGGDQVRLEPAVAGGALGGEVRHPVGVGHVAVGGAHGDGQGGVAGVVDGHRQPDVGLAGHGGEGARG